MNRKCYTVFKIVRAYGGALWSISFGPSDVCCVQYVPGQWVQAPEIMRRLGYDLCVFRDLTYVRSFVGSPRSRLRDWEVWRCDARGVRQPLLFSLGEEFVTVFIKSLLDGHALDIEAIPYGSWPHGTLFARSVRLVEPIPWDHELLR
jgi:hypothetical protein